MILNNYFLLRINFFFCYDSIKVLDEKKQNLHVGTPGLSKKLANEKRQRILAAEWKNLKKTNKVA